MTGKLQTQENTGYEQDGFAAEVVRPQKIGAAVNYLTDAVPGGFGKLAAVDVLDKDDLQRLGVGATPPVQAEAPQAGYVSFPINTVAEMGNLN
jgi:hypothetical protein